MARKRAKHVPQSTRVEVGELPASARVAWSYLGTLIAVIVAAAVVLVVNQGVAVAVCHGSAAGAIADCKFAWVVWSGVGAFLAVLIPIAWKLRLGPWFVVAMWAQIGLWVATDSIGAWWWWALVLLMPTIAALASHRWGSQPGAWRWQRVIIIAVGVGAVVALVWWYLQG